MSWEPRFLQGGGFKKKSDEELLWIASPFGVASQHGATRMRALRELGRRAGIPRGQALRMSEGDLRDAVIPNNRHGNRELSRMYRMGLRAR